MYRTSHDEFQHSFYELVVWNNSGKIVPWHAFPHVWPFGARGYHSHDNVSRLNIFKMLEFIFALVYRHPSP